MKYSVFEVMKEHATRSNRDFGQHWSSIAQRNNPNQVLNTQIELDSRIISLLVLVF